MTAFDHLLTQMGLKPMVYSDDKGKMVELGTTGRSVYSSMGHIHVGWCNEEGDVVAVTGLSEYGHPPTLVSPRPRLVIKRKDGMTEAHSYLLDAYLDRMISRVGAAEVLRMGMANEAWTDESILND